MVRSPVPSCTGRSTRSGGTSLYNASAVYALCDVEATKISDAQMGDVLAPSNRSATGSRSVWAEDIRTGPRSTTHRSVAGGSFLQSAADANPTEEGNLRWFTLRWL